MDMCLSCLLIDAIGESFSHLQSGEGGSSRADQHWPNWEYIGAQGPLPQTVADFWELAYEQNCTVILMLTNHVEGNVRKVRLSLQCGCGIEVVGQCLQPCTFQSSILRIVFLFVRHFIHAISVPVL